MSQFHIVNHNCKLFDVNKICRTNRFLASVPISQAIQKSLRPWIVKDRNLAKNNVQRRQEIVVSPFKFWRTWVRIRFPKIRFFIDNFVLIRIEALKYFHCQYIESHSEMKITVVERAQSSMDIENGQKPIKWYSEKKKFKKLKMYKLERC